MLELKKVAQDLGEDLTDEEIEKMFVKADLDDDGFVTADDFYNIMTHRVYWDQWADVVLCLIGLMAALLLAILSFLDFLSFFGKPD